MKSERITTTLLVTIVHEKPIKDVTDFVANRLWSIDGMVDVTAALFKVVQDGEYTLEEPTNQKRFVPYWLRGPGFHKEVTEEGQRQLVNLVKRPEMRGALEADTDGVTTGHNVSSGCGCAPLGDGTDAKCPRADGTLLCDDPLPEREHVLYEDSDADRPDVICDSNGQVCLALCKVCGKAEAELLDTPVCPGPVTTGFLQVNENDIGL